MYAFSLIALMNVSTCLAQKQNSKAGIFLDTLKVGGMELVVAVTIVENNGNYSATLNSLDQGSGEIPF